MDREARTARARELRRTAPECERRVWARLCGGNVGGFKFRRQYPIGDYFADFACVSARLIVELDGLQHGGQTEYDARRTQGLERAGWHVMRFDNHSVRENLDGVIEAIWRQLLLTKDRRT